MFDFPLFEKQGGKEIFLSFVSGHTNIAGETDTGNSILGGRGGR